VRVTYFSLDAATQAALQDLRYRHVDRTPWLLRRATAVFEAALRGPLHWFGVVAWGREVGEQGGVRELVARVQNDVETRFVTDVARALPERVGAVTGTAATWYVRGLGGEDLYRDANGSV
jgi:hypothetical protein